MKFLDFKERKIIETNNYTTKKIELQLQPLLDYKLSEFVDILQTSIESNLSNVDYENSNALLIRVSTDLSQEDLEVMRDQILESVARALITTKSKYKNGEKILGLPENFNQVDILRAVILDLINYNLKIENLNVKFYDKNGDQVARTI